jgi:lysozyme
MKKKQTQTKTKQMEKIKRVSKDCLALIEEFECGGDFRNFLAAYKCPAGKWTIGMGTTRYPSGQSVMPGDRITEQQVFEYVTYDLAAAESAVAHSVTAEISQQQFDAIVSFVYNLGVLAFKGSTLLKVININPADPAIEKQFRRWIMVGGKPLVGLVRRRRSEAYLYFNGSLKFNF